MSHKEPQKSPDADRKEKVLHTRIPAALEDEIKLLAQALSIPVSNLVRNILEDTVGMLATVKEHVDEAVTDLKADVTSLSTHVARDRQALRRRWAEYQAAGLRATGRPHDEPADGPLAREPAAPIWPTGAAPAEPPTAPEPAVPPPRPARSAPAAYLEEILGWQPLTLNALAHCETCGVRLGRGAQAYLGLGDPLTTRLASGSPQVQPRVFICPACLPPAGPQKE